MRLVVVGFPSSIHLAKAVAMLGRLDWDVHVVPSADQPWIDEFAHCTVHHYSRIHEPPAETPTRGVVRWSGRLETRRSTPRGEGAALLARLVDELRPDLVHSHELQSGAFLAYEARSLCPRPFPPWVISNWGSDIYFYARDPEQRAACRAVLAAADGYWSECARDVAIARAEGFRGTVLPVLPIAGGLWGLSARETCSSKGRLG